jgi:hypothetical protein
MATSVAKGPKYRPQWSKRAEKNLVAPGKPGAELLTQFIKKGAELFYVWFFIKLSIFPALN